MVLAKVDGSVVARANPDDCCPDLDKIVLSFYDWPPWLILLVSMALGSKFSPSCLKFVIGCNDAGFLIIVIDIITHLLLKNSP